MATSRVATARTDDITQPERTEAPAGDAAELAVCGVEDWVTATAHTINNELTVIQAHLAILLVRSHKEEDQAVRLRAVQAAAGRIRDTVLGMTQVAQARLETERPSTLNIRNGLSALRRSDGPDTRLV